MRHLVAAVIYANMQLLLILRSDIMTILLAMCCRPGVFEEKTRSVLGICLSAFLFNKGSIKVMSKPVRILVASFNFNTSIVERSFAVR